MLAAGDGWCDRIIKSSSVSLRKEAAMASTLNYYTITVHEGERLSAQEFAALPDEPGVRMELDRGRVIKMVGVKDPLHDFIVGNLYEVLSPFVKRHQLGGVTLEQLGYNITQQGEADESVWMPDLAFISISKAEVLREARKGKAYLPFAPDLLFEVVSPTQHAPEMKERIERWLAAGTRLAWVAWPEQQAVDVWQPDEPMRTLKRHESLDGLEVVPGFLMLLADLFKPPFAL
jgi:Uma2 family endonuclease